MRPLSAHFASILRQGKMLSTGLVGQVASFAAMLLPLATGHLREVAFLVAVSSVAGISSFAGTWSFVSVYPSIQNEGESSVAFPTSATMLLLVSAVPPLLPIIIPQLNADLSLVLYWSPALTVALGLNLLLTGVLIRNSNLGELTRLRLASGLTNLLFVSAFVAFYRPGQGNLVIPTSLALAAPTLWGLGRLVARRRDSLPPWRFSGRYLKKHYRAAGAAALGGAAYHLLGIATPLLGVAGQAWAIALRIAGGFTTISQQVISPFLEARLSSALRADQVGSARRIHRHGFVLGCLYSVPCIAAVLTTIAVTGSTTDFGSASRDWGTGGAVSILTFSLVSTSLVTRNLVLCGGQGLFFRWAVLKLTASFVILLSLRGQAMFLAFSLSELFAQILYYNLVNIALRRREIIANRSRYQVIEEG